MKLYDYHSDPMSLDNYSIANESVPELFWDKYKNNPVELKKKEAMIAKVAQYAYWYAIDILNGSFPAGEAAIAKDVYYSVLYSRSSANDDSLANS